MRRLGGILKVVSDVPNVTGPSSTKAQVPGATTSVTAQNKVRFSDNSQKAEFGPEYAYYESPSTWKYAQKEGLREPVVASVRQIRKHADRTPMEVPMDDDFGEAEPANSRLARTSVATKEARGGGWGEVREFTKQPKMTQAALTQALGYVRNTHEQAKVDLEGNYEQASSWLGGVNKGALKAMVAEYASVVKDLPETGDVKSDILSLLKERLSSVHAAPTEYHADVLLWLIRRSNWVDASSNIRTAYEARLTSLAEHDAYMEKK